LHLRPELFPRCSRRPLFVVVVVITVVVVVVVKYLIFCTATPPTKSGRPSGKSFTTPSVAKPTSIPHQSIHSLQLNSQRVPQKYSRLSNQRSQCPNTSAWFSHGSSQSPPSPLHSSLPSRALVITSLARRHPMAGPFSRGKAEMMITPLILHYSQAILPLNVNPRKSTTLHHLYAVAGVGRGPPSSLLAHTIPALSTQPYSILFLSRVLWEGLPRPLRSAFRPDPVLTGRFDNISNRCYPV
jgi:hypothetical protein